MRFWHAGAHSALGSPPSWIAVNVNSLGILPTPGQESGPTTTNATGDLVASGVLLTLISTVAKPEGGERRVE